MALDIKKRISSAALPIGGMVILGLFDSLVDVFVPSLADTVGIIVLVLDFAILGWVGFKVSKEGGSLRDSAVTGIIAGAVSFFISILISIALSVDIPPTDNIGLIVLTILGVILGAVFGAILGAAGGFVGRKTGGEKKGLPKP